MTIKKESRSSSRKHCIVMARVFFDCLGNYSYSYLCFIIIYILDTIYSYYNIFLI